MYQDFVERVRAPQHRKSTACFSVVADADPGVMPRVLELFAKRGLVPSLWHSKIAPTGELIIDLQMEGMEASMARQIAGCLRQMWGVSTVLTAEKG
jgi:acetolactate synthase small subunit